MSSAAIGDLVLAFLRSADGVAYVRFASVYSEFADLDEFLENMRDLAVPAKSDAADASETPPHDD